MKSVRRFRGGIGHRDRKHTIVSELAAVNGKKKKNKRRYAREDRMEGREEGLRWTSPGAAAVEREQKHRQLVRFARAAPDLILSAIGLLGQQRRVTCARDASLGFGPSRHARLLALTLPVFLLPLPFSLFIPSLFYSKYLFSRVVHLCIALHWLGLLSLRPLPPHYASCSSEAASPHNIPHRDS